ncbi:MAG TPA: fibronectin type III domain-containing protein, partial [Verrucomicrobiota bacterium]|nr:fibronectin type III domain-containing protein [Verrucomicrobiota bacterium]
MHAAAFTTNAVTLAWEPSPDSSVTGYKIYYGAASGVYTNSVDVGGSTSGEVNGLVAGVTYYFVVTAYTVAGVESLPSNEVSYTVPVILVNQPPTLNSLSNVTLNEDAGQQTVNLSGITAGATNESQTLTVTATSSNTGL